MRVHALLNEITRPETYQDAADRLRQAGYDRMGSGDYAHVVGKPDVPYVVKLFTSDDQGYLAFLKLITSHQNPHFPRAFGKPFLVRQNYYAVRIERLAALHPKRHGFFYEHILPFKMSVKHKPEKTYSFDAEYPELADAIRLIVGLINSGLAYDDFTVDNIMQRGDTIVITDPVS